MTHEGYWNPKFYRHESVPNSLCGDVSWMAPPAIESSDSGSPPINVIHLIRNPHLVSASLVANKFWEIDGPYRDFALKHTNVNAPETDDPYLLSARFWVEWNNRCLNLSYLKGVTAGVSFYVEDLFAVGRNGGKQLKSRPIRVPHPIASQLGSKFLSRLGNLPANRRETYDFPSMVKTVDKALWECEGYQQLRARLIVMCGQEPASWLPVRPLT